MPSDFNGDGRDDILWRNVDGRISNWLATANGGFLVNDANAAVSVPTSWVVAGTGDFNGDGRDDLLWVNYSTGVVSNWLATASGGWIINDAAALTALPTDRFVIGIGDFNGDGRDDVLFSSELDGSRTYWWGDADGGFTPSGYVDPLIAGQYVFLDSVADFDGDGASDILWYNPTSGAVGYYYNWGGEFLDSDFITPSAGGGWEIAGTGDFNGDGCDDILWRNPTTGMMSNWLSQQGNDFIVNDANALRYVPTEWHIVAIGDYNGDGRDDILWRNASTGAVSNWLATANGGFIVNDANAASTVPLDWYVNPGNAGEGSWDYF